MHSFQGWNYLLLTWERIVIGHQYAFQNHRTDCERANNPGTKGLNDSSGTYNVIAMPLLKIAFTCEAISISRGYYLSGYISCTLES